MYRVNFKQGFSAIMAALALASAPAAAQPPGDEVLGQMREAYRQGQSERLAVLLPQARGHVLEPLAAYWSLRARLDSASAQEIRSMLDRYRGTYWEDRLRNDWLLELGKAQDWASFDAERPRFRMNDDRQVQCYGLMSDLVAGRTELAQAAKQTGLLWLAQPDADEACAALARHLLNRGAFPPGTVWQRARLGMDTGKSAVAVQAVTLLDAAWAAPLQAIVRDPQTFLDSLRTPLPDQARDLTALAIIRLAAIDPDAAAAQMQRPVVHALLDSDDRHWLWGSIGRRAAIKLQPQALDHFARGQARRMHPDHLAWKARAALRAGAWDSVHQTIEAMPGSMQQQPVWIYWRARAIEALQRPDPIAAMVQARQLDESIASAHGFYQQLALEALGQRVRVPPGPTPPTEQEMATARQDPGLQRALAAMRLGLRSEGVREWHYTVSLHTPGGMEDRQLLAAAALACEQEIWDRCINTSLRTRAGHDLRQRFPTPFREAIEERAQALGLPPAYVYGLIRQESRFVTDARSGAGAQGLMQVMPATARWTARHLGLTSFRDRQITDRDTNLLLGMSYLRRVLDEMDGSLPMAAAAYNAGPGRPREWRQGPVLPAAIWIENIPFEETRHYVQQVLSNTTVYAALLSDEPQSLRERLGTVAPRTDTASVKSPVMR